MGRDYDPVPGQWYENAEEEETFQVLSVDEDSELIEIQYLDGDIEEIDLETWAEMDLEKVDEPEGWSGSEADDAKEERRRRKTTRTMTIGMTMTMTMTTTTWTTTTRTILTELTS